MDITTIDQELINELLQKAYGKMRPDRIAFFEELLELREKYKRVNQWG